MDENLDKKYKDVAGGFKKFIETTSLETEKNLIKNKIRLFDFHKQLTLLLNDLDFYIQNGNIADVVVKKHFSEIKERTNTLLNLCHNNYIIPINQVETRKSINIGKWSVWLGLGSVILGFLSIFWVTRDISNKKIVSEFNNSIDSTTIQLVNKIQNQEKIVFIINTKLDSTLKNNIELNKKIIILEREIKSTKSVANKVYKSLGNK